MGRIQAFLSHQVGDQLYFVGPGAVQLAAVNHFEMLGEVEMPGDFPGENPGFGGCNVQLSPLSAEHFQQWCDTVEYAVFVQSGDLEAFSVEVHRRPGLGLVEVIELHEGLQQGRADEVLELGQVGLIDPQLAQGKLNRTGNAFARVGQGAIKVEQNGLVMHEYSWARAR
ncbi:hypothetical protein D3C76_1372680 [compost metagenome]